MSIKEAIEFPKEVLEASAAGDMAKVREFLAGGFTRQEIDRCWQQAKAERKKLEGEGKTLSPTLVLWQLNVLHALLDMRKLLDTTRHAALEARVKALEAKPALPALQYLGVWEAKDYAVGSFVTANGCVWHCREPAGPGDAPNASRCWQLAVKRGRDAKERYEGRR